MTRLRALTDSFPLRLMDSGESLAYMPKSGTRCRVMIQRSILSVLIVAITLSLGRGVIAQDDVPSGEPTDEGMAVGGQPVYDEPAGTDQPMEGAPVYGEPAGPDPAIGGGPVYDEPEEPDSAIGGPAVGGEPDEDQPLY